MIKKIYLVLFAMFLFSNVTISQINHILTIQADSFPNKKFEISFFYKGNKYYVDTVKIDKSGKAKWIFPPNAKIGMYQLKLMEELEKKFLFIYNKENITIILPGLNETKDPHYKQSLENELLSTYNILQTNFSHISDIAFSYPTDDPFFKIILNEYKIRQKKIDDFVNNLKKTKPNMFITKMASFEWRNGLQPEPGLTLEQRKKFLNEHYFEGIDFSDTTILYFPSINDFIINYFNLQVMVPSSFKLSIQDQYKNIVDNILNKTKQYPTIYSFMIDFIIEGMEKANFEDVITYIYENYISEGTCDDYTTPVVERAKKRANQKKLLIKGKKMPNITLPDTNQNKTSLYDINADLIILVFWASLCEHCEKEIPLLYEWYKNYNESKGYNKATNMSKPVEVFAVSLDEDEKLWKTFIKDKGLDWINVCDFKRWESPAVLTYFIFNTPTYIIMNKDKQLIGVPSDVDLLKIMINEIK
ncbi:MAG TPA: thioredoxin-like domain-containing protein [Bacteroidales bacterium]|nr:thioredoxin-like domain-containing protein [Bacteroidales bacterium]